MNAETAYECVNTKWNNMNKIELTDRQIKILDQRELPGKIIHHDYNNYREIAFALEENLITGIALRTYAVLAGISVTAKSLQSQNVQSKDELISVIKYLEKCDSKNLLSGKMVTIVLDAIDNNTPNTFSETIEQIISSFKDTMIASENKVSSLLYDILADNETILLCSSSGTSLSSLSSGPISGALEKAASNNKKISTMCLESRPDLSGAGVLAFNLYKAGHITTVLPDIQAETVFRKKLVNKVVINAEGQFPDGSLLCRCGTAMILRSAREYNITTVCTCLSTFKFDAKPDASLLEAEGSVYDVALIKGTPIVPEGVMIRNFAYDIIEAGNFSTVLSD